MNVAFPTNVLKDVNLEENISIVETLTLENCNWMLWLCASSWISRSFISFCGVTKYLEVLLLISRLQIFNLISNFMLSNIIRFVLPNPVVRCPVHVNVMQICKRLSVYKSTSHIIIVEKWNRLIQQKLLYLGTSNHLVQNIRNFSSSSFSSDAQEWNWLLLFVFDTKATRGPKPPHSRGF